MIIEYKFQAEILKKLYENDLTLEPMAQAKLKKLKKC